MREERLVERGDDQVAAIVHLAGGLGEKRLVVVPQPRRAEAREKHDRRHSDQQHSLSHLLPHSCPRWRASPKPKCGSLEKTGNGGNGSLQSARLFERTAGLLVDTAKLTPLCASAG